MYSALEALAVEEMSDGTFLAYVVALAISGIAMIILAALPIGGSVGRRALNAVLGLAMLGYGFYLFFIFDGGTVRIFYYVFILPIVMIWRTVQGAKESRAAREAQQAQSLPAPSATGQPDLAPQSAQPSEQAPAHPVTKPEGTAAAE